MLTLMPRLFFSRSLWSQQQTPASNQRPSAQRLQVQPQDPLPAAPGHSSVWVYTQRGEDLPETCDHFDQIRGKILIFIIHFFLRPLRFLNLSLADLKMDSSITSFIFFSIKTNSQVLPFIMWMVTLSATVWYQWVVCLPSSRCSSKCCQRSRSNGKTIKWRDRREWRSWQRSSLVSNPSPGWRKTVRDKSWKFSWRKGNVFSVFI